MTWNLKPSSPCLFKQQMLSLQYTQCCEEHEYGLYTELARKAREEANGIKDYRQW